MADGFARKPRREKKLIAKNRSAHHEYFIDETFECGVELAGTEVRSLRERACQITDSFALIRNGECWLHNVHIHPYSNGSIFNRDPDRRRKLLLHRKQIDYLDGKLRTRGVALVPLELYFNEDGRVKLLLGLAEVRSCTTSARTWPSATCSARSIGLSSNVAGNRPFSFRRAPMCDRVPVCV